MSYSTEINNSYIHRDRRAIAAWLVFSALLVACMVVLGGYTRLSGSGLSITEWKPVHGTLPPMNDAQWQEEFTGYVMSPQYEKVNRGMNLDQFKKIFWPEYLHRLLGRTIGMVFLIPFIIFACRRSFSKRFAFRLISIFVLGGLQGLIGWLMVKSGLIDEPNVSPYRLALHLIVAFAIYTLILWAFLDISRSTEIIKKSIGYYLFWFILLVVQLGLGALMAGFHAGLLYNTWPTMDGQWIPDGLFYPKISLFANIIFIQFLHRTLAAVVALGFLFWWYSNRVYVKNSHLGKVCAGVTAIIALQFILGVATLLHQVPLPLALAHQMVALLLLTMAVILLHRLSPCSLAGSGN